MAGLPTSGVCPFVPFFPSQAISPDLSCTISSDLAVSELLHDDARVDALLKQ